MISVYGLITALKICVKIVLDDHLSKKNENYYVNTLKIARNANIY